MKLTIIRKQLEQMYQQLEQELSLVSVKGNALILSLEAGSSRSEDASVATNDFERRVALEKQKRSHLAEIKHSLHKLETGSYGICDGCDQPIEQRRLEALPYATQCVQCKATAGKKIDRSYAGQTW